MILRVTKETLPKDIISKYNWSWVNVTTDDGKIKKYILLMQMILLIYMIILIFSIIWMEMMIMPMAK